MRSNPQQRGILLSLLLAAIFTILYLSSYHSSDSSVQQSLSTTPKKSSSNAPSAKGPNLTGPAIASKIGNETLKAELGRAAWKLFHTTFAQFPDKPTPDESAALDTYIHLFQRLYPCGECAAHFGVILKKFPPQVATRSTAAAWGCHVHNEVNKSLKKKLFDCSNIGDFYDCGCAKDGKDASGKEAQKTLKASGEGGSITDAYKEKAEKKVEMEKVG
ncbi:erv1 alr family protein [Venturia nashicola]|uniref:Sulfhydryl oxidase n=1 Tax=Venturia nashicola TaxID=86259 RepID=A0A4Z1PVF5_9PEZI|nr:erv1 alr family protein [Venturia nashicola]TLD39173.1 erv1 alr family protein [Venturia nashicola]